MILLKMTIKNIVIQLEKYIGLKFPHYAAKFYANRRNFYIHLGLDKSFFSSEDYKHFLEEINIYFI